jgi:hypothetical protein
MRRRSRCRGSACGGVPGPRSAAHCGSEHPLLALHAGLWAGAAAHGEHSAPTGRARGKVRGGDMSGKTRRSGTYGSSWQTVGPIDATLRDRPRAHRFSRPRRARTAASSPPIRQHSPPRHHRPWKPSGATVGEQDKRASASPDPATSANTSDRYARPQTCPLKGFEPRTTSGRW